LPTIHANSAVKALSRLEDLIGEVTQRVPYRAIAQAINLVVSIERTPSGRQVRSVTPVVGREGEGYRLEEVTGSASRAAGGVGLSALLG
jgi:type IV secretion system protein VirB11